MTNLELDAFLETVHYGSISKAAEMLFITQPALSRRIEILEKELGYSLLERKRGVRTVSLTRQGELFVAVARKYKEIWNEAQEIGRDDRSVIFNFSAIDSLNSGIMSPVYREFMKQHPQVRLNINTFHTKDAYEYVERGFLDLAFVSDALYLNGVETKPVLKEEMMYVSREDDPARTCVSPRDLNPARQLQLYWDSGYERWRQYWFGMMKQPNIWLDNITLLGDFLKNEDCWAVAPASVAFYLEQTGQAKVRRFVEGPPDRVIYYLTGNHSKREVMNAFLETFGKQAKMCQGISLYEV